MFEFSISKKAAIMHVEGPGLLREVINLTAKGLAMLVLSPFILLFAIIVMAMVIISPELRHREEKHDRS